MVWNGFVSGQEEGSKGSSRTLQVDVSRMWIQYSQHATEGAALLEQYSGRSGELKEYVRMVCLRHSRRILLSRPDLSSPAKGGE